MLNTNMPTELTWTELFVWLWPAKIVFVRSTERVDQRSWPYKRHSSTSRRADTADRRPAAMPSTGARSYPGRWRHRTWPVTSSSPPPHTAASSSSSSERRQITSTASFHYHNVLVSYRLLTLENVNVKSIPSCNTHGRRWSAFH